MDGRALKKWRKQLGYTQEEAAKHLGVVRSTIQNWEHEITVVPGAIDFACEECVRLWKQRPDFGPVLLVYADGPIWPTSYGPNCLPLLRCEPYSHNDAAIQKALRLRDDQNFADIWILEEGDNVIWNSPELLLECARRSTLRNAV
jgi:DNA-binding XRE family transcriptional regulator